MSDEVLNFDEASSNITRKDTPITVDEIRPHLRNDKKEVAQIRNTVESTYPEAQVGNSLNGSIFGDDEFGFGDGNTYEEKRVAWIDVPKGTTKEQVAARLKQFPSARIYRVLSLTPILTDEQKRAMENGISNYTDPDTGEIKPCDMEYYKRRQMVPTPDTMNLPEDQRQPLLYNGYVQYRVTFFSPEGQEDEDHRPAQLKAQQEKEAAFTMNEATVTKEVEAAEGF